MYINESIYVWMNVCIYVCVPHICLPGVCESQERVVDPLELELWMVVNHTVDIGNGTLSPLQGQHMFLNTEPALQVL